VTRAPAIPAVAIVHQEGFLGLIAVVGLSFGERGLSAALAPAASIVTSLAVGVVVASAAVALLWLLRGLPPLARLEQWQRGVVVGWSVTDAVAVAVLSGLAEEALLRAFLQPIVGLLPTAGLFAVLHLVPDRELWIWPIVAFAAGLVLGVSYDRFGFPAAAAAHILINLVALLRLRLPAAE
jgi:membrane protease YdiL (CAAX protease family)